MTPLRLFMERVRTGSWKERKLKVQLQMDGNQVVLDVCVVSCCKMSIWLE